MFCHESFNIKLFLKPIYHFSMNRNYFYMLTETYILEILHYNRLEVYLEHFILYNIQNLSKQHQDINVKKIPYFV